MWRGWYVYTHTHTHSNVCICDKNFAMIQWLTSESNKPWLMSLILTGQLNIVTLCQTKLGKYLHMSQVGEDSVLTVVTFIGLHKFALCFLFF